MMLARDPLRHRWFSRLTPGRHEPHLPSARIGLVMLVWLVVLTIVDYVLAVSIENNRALLAAFAFVEAGLVAYYFMHVTAVFREREEQSP